MTRQLRTGMFTGWWQTRHFGGHHTTTIGTLRKKLDVSNLEKPKKN